MTVIHTAATAGLTGLTPHVLFLFGKMEAGNELTSNNFETLEGGKKCIDSC